MAIEAHFDEGDGDAQGGAGATERPPRLTLRLDTAGMTQAGTPAPVKLHNISASGMLIETAVALAVDERMAIDLPLAGATVARVIWQSGALYGCQFDRPLPRSVLSAAQLRSAVTADLLARPAEDPSPASVERGDGFAGRLQRLRKASGLSLAQVAEELGVSKPTVWAWEQGKAHPVDSRIAALAQALGVPTSELVSGTGDPAVRDLIADCRARIAETFGISAEKIRIVIDL